MIELTAGEISLLSQLAATIDMNLDRLAAAEQGIKVSTTTFTEAWRLVVRSKGLNPDLYRTVWENNVIAIELIE